MIITLGTTVLPAYTEITGIITPNASENVTLDGSIHVDFVNKRRGWKIRWNLLDATYYEQIMTLYNLQFSSGNFNNLTIDTEGITALPVYMKISQRDIKYNGGFVENFELELIEQDGV